MHFVTHICIHNSGNAVRVGLIDFQSAGKIHPSGCLRRIFPIAIQAFGIFQLLLSQGLRNKVGMMDGITVFERIERECSAVIQVFFEINFVAVEEITGGIIAVLFEKVSVLRQIENLPFFGFEIDNLKTAAIGLVFDGIVHLHIETDFGIHAGEQQGARKMFRVDAGHLSRHDEASGTGRMQLVQRGHHGLQTIDVLN